MVWCQWQQIFFACLQFRFELSGFSKDGRGMVATLAGPVRMIATGAECHDPLSPLWPGLHHQSAAFGIYSQQGCLLKCGTYIAGATAAAATCLDQATLTSSSCCNQSSLAWDLRMRPGS